MNYQKITNLLFTADEKNIDFKYDCVIILGSRNCEYRVKTALEVNSKMYICSGGNYTKYKDTNGNPIMEAYYMKMLLLEAGIDEASILTESKSNYTYQNFANCRKYINNDMQIGVVTAGFHTERVRRILKETGYIAKIIPAYGPHTSRENWYKNDMGIAIVCDELQKVFPELAEDLIK